ncbi:MAG: radical SAM protein, partial [Nitrospirota bacterium]|nr:radical SAM protein [Nitrospirota bacterium]
EEKICKYIDMPVQHINDKILNHMHRGHTRKSIYGTIEQLRKNIPNVVLRTSLIVGFPGETEDQFRELVEFVRDVEFDRLGVFPYSNEEGTMAYSMTDQIREREMKKRREVIMKTQQEISLKKNQRLIGSRQTLLVEGPSQDGRYLLEGRTYAHAPEVDGVIYVSNAPANAPEDMPVPGEFVPVEITEAQPYDLIGRLV